MADEEVEWTERQRGGKSLLWRGPVGVAEAGSFWGLSENLELTPQSQAGRQVDVQAPVLQRAPADGLY